MTLFDIPEEIGNFINVAIETQTVDALSVYALGTIYGNNWRELVDKIIEYAAANQHTDGDAYSKVLEAALPYWISIRTS